MKSEQIFAAKAADYAFSRPSYAPEAVHRIVSQMLHDGDQIADVGSGTGIFSREFPQRGYDVFCVEPNEAMRLQAEAACAENPHFHSIAATAEHTGLPLHSMALVTAASASHWFDTDAFYRECKRILKPGGMVCILFNARVMDSFTLKQHQICLQTCPDYTSLTHGVDKAMQKAASFFKGEFSTERFSFPLHFTKQKFIARCLSSSYAPEKGSPRGEEYSRALQALLDETFSADEVVIANETVMLWGKLC